MSKMIFPVGIPASWCSPEKAKIPDPYLKNWLLDTGSLTERLQSQCRHFELHVLGQSHAPLSESECQAMGIENVDECQWQVREVLLSGNGMPWVFARSVIPQVICNGDLKGLGNSPLGQILFNDSRFIRQPFEVCFIENAQSLTTTLDVATAKHLWGRRSVFSFQGYPILVAEVFLPGSPAYSHRPEMVSNVAEI